VQSTSWSRSSQRRHILYYFTKEGKARWKKTSLDEKDKVAICILCSAKMKAVKVSAEAKKLSKRQLASSGEAAPKKKM